MTTAAIPLSRLAANLQATLSECADSGRAVVVELPDHRLVAIRPFEPDDTDDDLTDELLASDEGFRALVAKSAASPRKSFPPPTGV